jgi:hypothetical protein
MHPLSCSRLETCGQAQRHCLPNIRCFVHTSQRRHNNAQSIFIVTQDHTMDGIRFFKTSIPQKHQSSLSNIRSDECSLFAHASNDVYNGRYGVWKRESLSIKREFLAFWNQRNLCPCINIILLKGLYRPK